MILHAGRTKDIFKHADMICPTSLGQIRHLLAQ